MMGQTASRLLVLWLTAVGSSVCLAQGKTSANAEVTKKACDVHTKADAESILGTTVEAKGDSAFVCWFMETGWTNKAQKNKQVQLSVW